VHKVQQVAFRTKIYTPAEELQHALHTTQAYFVSAGIFPSPFDAWISYT